MALSIPKVKKMGAFGAEVLPDLDSTSSNVRLTEEKIIQGHIPAARFSFLDYP